jgi:L-threonylcarbamoyladenylate synthase
MTERLRDDADGIARAATLLRTGHLVAFATETVYGLGADATNPAAVAAIYTAKSRPQFNPLICHFADAASAFAHAIPNRHAHSLAAAFWPGPLTLILPRHPDSTIATLAAAGLPSIALRVPAHATARALLQAASTPIAAPSANRSGRLSPTTADHVAASLTGRIAAILDSGPTSIGLESTIIDLTSPTPTLLRPGGIPIETLQSLLGPIRHPHHDPNTTSLAPIIAPIIAPGMTRSHYAPNLPLRLNATAPTASEAWLAFGPTPHTTRLTINLSPTANLAEAAATLFDALHRLDALAPPLGLTSIAIAPIPPQGLGQAINDRLARAAAPPD